MTADNITDRWQQIRNYYRSRENELINEAKKGKWIEPYPFDWMSSEWKNSPPEYWVWESLRVYGREGGHPLMIFYPQYPILNYFVDFGDPLKKIAIEVDGARWHSREKDEIREHKIIESGWKILRIPARLTFCSMMTPWNSFRKDSDSELNILIKLNQWIRETSDGLIFALRIINYEEWWQNNSGEKYDLLWNMPEGMGDSLLNACYESIKSNMHEKI